MWPADPASRDHTNGLGLSSIVAREAIRSLHAELVLYPKPGLVSPIDNGSHADMNAATFMRSIVSLRRYFRQVTQAGADGAGFATLAMLGIAAERRMLAATGGINTHRGAIFCLGLLCAASGKAYALAGNDGPADTFERVGRNDGAIEIVRASDNTVIRSGPPAAFATRCSADMIRSTLLDSWRTNLEEHCERRQTAAHGTGVALVHGIGGARTEAAAGMPSIFDIALPALRRTLAAGRDWQCACTDAFFALLAELEDTNVYHRGGACGAALVRQQAHRFIDNGGTANERWRRDAIDIHRLFVDRRLSPGGAADLLAGTCLVFQLTGVTSDNGPAREMRDMRDVGLASIPAT